MILPNVNGIQTRQKEEKNSLQDFRNAVKNHPHQCGRVACLKALQLDSIAINGGEKSITTTWDQKYNVTMNKYYKSSLISIILKEW